MDFTKTIIDAFYDYCKNNLNINPNFDLKHQQKIYEQAELAKHILSFGKTALITLNYEDNEICFSITPEDFEEKSFLLLNKIKDVIKRVVSDSKLAASDIDKVILAGGSSRMLPLRHLISRMFSKLPHCHLNPDTVIVEGVAIQSGLKTQDKALEEIIVTDVCPYSLGVAVQTKTNNNQYINYFDPIIERNMVIPTSKSRFYSFGKDQSFVTIDIYQGENISLEKNIFLGTLKIKIPPNLTKNEIEIRFTYDINGLLEVQATIPEINEIKTLIIEGNPGVMSEKEITERLAELAELKVHPREKTENLYVLSKAERLFEDLTGEKRVHIGNLIKSFLFALNNQDEIDIIRQRTLLLKIVEEINQ